ncbi:MAG TPA: hypothetical protein VGG78_11060 [Gemmatimonadaceae bacterium]
MIGSAPRSREDNSRRETRKPADGAPDWMPARFAVAITALVMFGAAIAMVVV